MDSAIKEMVIQSIYNRYPAYSGASPTVRKKTIKRLGIFKQSVYTFTFRGEGRAPDGTKMQQRLVVTVTPSGRILKTVTSR